MNLVTINDDATTVDGFVLGLCNSVAKNLGVGFGYAVRRRSEISPGFQRAAVQFVRDSNDQNLKDRYSSRESGMKMSNGLPQVDDAGNRYFPGPPIIERFNHSIFVGLTAPVGLKPLHGGVLESGDD